MTQATPAETLGQLATGLSESSIEAVLGLFVKDEGSISCLFGDQEDWARGTDAVHSAIAEFVAGHPSCEVSFDDVTAHSVGATSHVVSGTMHLKWRDASELLKRSARFNGVLVNQVGVLRFLHFAEAPIAPLIELQKFYEKIARHGHPV